MLFKHNILAKCICFKGIL